MAYWHVVASIKLLRDITSTYVLHGSPTIVQLCNWISRVILLRNWIRFLPHSQTLALVRVWLARLSDRYENAKEAFEAYISSIAPVEGKRTRSAVIH